MEDNILLEFKKLVSELSFLENNLNLLKSKIEKSDKEFKEEVDRWMYNKPELKELIIDSEVVEGEDILQEVIEDKVENDELDVELRSLFRLIVLKTHPDKVGSDTLVGFYDKSIKAYDIKSRIELLKIVYMLDINYSPNKNDVKFLSEKCDELKREIEFNKNKISFIWSNSDKLIKNNIIIDFLKKKLIYK